MQKIIQFALICGLSVGCGSQMKMQSQWRDRDIAIDGADEEWHGGMQVIEKKNVSIGLFNDEEYLYLRLITLDRQIRRQIMMQGFVIWFDRNGGEDKQLGIRFPLGMMESGMFRGGRGRGEPGDMRRDFEKSLDRLEILFPKEEDSINMALSELIGIEVHVGVDRERLVYEIKMPLQKSDQTPYAIDVTAGQIIGIGLETAKFDFAVLRQQMGERPPGGGGFGGVRGGIGEGRGGYGGGPGSFGGRGGFQRAKQFKLWTQVELHAKASSEKAMPSITKKSASDR